jgi:hypothetical protein
MRTLTKYVFNSHLSRSITRTQARRMGEMFELFELFLVNNVDNRRDENSWL